MTSKLSIENIEQYISEYEGMTVEEIEATIESYINDTENKGEYIRNLIMQLKSAREKIIGHRFRKKIHPILLKQMKNMRKYELLPSGDTISNKKILEETLAEGPVIFAINHSNVHDVPTSGEIIEEHCYLLASDEVRGNFDGFLFELMGVAWVPRNSAKKKRTELSPKAHMNKLIEENQSLKTFPEGTWNVTDNLIILPFRWGDVAISQKTQRPIIPIIMDYNYAENACYYNIGKPMYVAQNADLKEANEQLRDEMATLRYTIWEENDKKRRENPKYLTGKEYTDAARVEFQAYKEKLKEEYPSFDEEEQAKNIYYPYTRREEVYQHMKVLTPNRNNAFLYGKNKNI